METTKHAPVVVVNLDESQFIIVEHVCIKELNMKVHEDERDDWDLKWTDNNINPEDLSRMKKFQKINHFPGMSTIARKNMLAIHISRMQKLFPNEFDFMPRSWSAPIDKFELKLFLSNKPGVYLIVKPDSGSQGRGIFLTRNLDEIDARKHLVQEYISNPYLIEGLKFDLRLYVLISGCDPLRIFIFKEGLARFATDEYDPPNYNNYENTFMHLTNYAINKWNDAYRNNQFLIRDNVGHKRSLTAIMNYLKQQREDTDGLMERIEDMVIKTIIMAKPTLTHNYHACQPEDYSNSMCFEILGFDILIDDDLNPFILEVNATPSFATNSPLDWNLKKAVILNSLKIVNLSSENKEKWNLREKFLHVQRKLHGFTWKLNPDQKEVIKDRMKEKRNDWELQNLGGFRRIYPTEDSDKYDKFIDAAEEIYQKFTGIKRPTRKLSPDLLNISVNVLRKKSSSVSKLSASIADQDELYSRLAQPHERVVKTKFLPKVIYHHHESTSKILKMSPSSIQKIDLAPKQLKQTQGLLENRIKGKLNVPMDIKIIHRKSPGK